MFQVYCCMMLTHSVVLCALLCTCRAQREEITSLRRALAETQDVMYKGKSAYNDVVQTKDMQIAQVRTHSCAAAIASSLGCCSLQVRVI